MKAKTFVVLTLIFFPIVGDAAVGKTSILRSYVDENFSTTYASTIGN
jgi:GTPase SAR1 family protein